MEKCNGEFLVFFIFNNVWGNLYFILKNVCIVINISFNEVMGNYMIKGIGEVLVVINVGLIVDLFGDIFFS